VNVLKFKNWNEVFNRDKLEFLRVLVPHYAHHTYFQNISMNAVPPEQRRSPDDKETLSTGLKGVGGPCVIQNGFLVILLKALGLNAYAISSCVKGPGLVADNHVICIVEFTPEKKYLLDLGVALPFAEPVPMHQLPYTKTAAGLRYQYKLAEEGGKTYVRTQLDGELFGALYEDKNYSYVRYDFTMPPQPINFFVPTLKQIFTDVDTSFFLQQPFLFRYFEEDNSGKLLDEVNVTGNRKWILIRGVSVLVGTDEAKKVTHYANYEEVRDIILKYFPKLPREDVVKAIGYFKECVPKHGYFKAT